MATKKIIKDVPVITKEINTNPNKREEIGGNKLTKCEVMGDLMPYGYACKVGEFYYFPANVFNELKNKNLLR